MRVSIDHNSIQVRAAFDRLGPRMAEAVHGAMQRTGFEGVDRARELTSHMVPGVKKGEGPRATHLGGWADISGNLAASIGHRVDHAGAVFFLTWFARMYYAVYLERLGYWVLSGLLEGFAQDSFSTNLRAQLRARPA